MFSILNTTITSPKPASHPPKHRLCFQVNCLMRLWLSLHQFAVSEISWPIDLPIHSSAEPLINWSNNLPVSLSVTGANRVHETRHFLQSYHCKWCGSDPSVILEGGLKGQRLASEINKMFTWVKKLFHEQLGQLYWIFIHGRCYNAIIVASNFHHLVWIVSCINPHSDDLELLLCQHLISRLVSFSSESPLTSITTVSTLAEFGHTLRPRNALDVASRATWDDDGGRLLRGMYFTKFTR